MSIKYVYLPLADLVFSSLRGIGSLEVCNSTDATRKNALKAGASGNASGGGILRGDKGPKTMPPLSVTLFCTIRERFVCCNCNSWSISYTRFGFNIHIFSYGFDNMFITRLHLSSFYLLHFYTGTFFFTSFLTWGW